MSVSVPEVASRDDDDDITDEEVFDESRNSKSPQTECDTEVTNEPPRSDSALTVALEVDMVPDGHLLSPINIVDLASPVTSSLLKSSTNEPLTVQDEQRDSHLHVKNADAQNSKPKETQSIYIFIYYIILLLK